MLFEQSLDHHDQNIQSVTVQGLCKLMLCKMYKSAEVSEQTVVPQCYQFSDYDAHFQDSQVDDIVVLLPFYGGQSKAKAMSIIFLAGLLLFF